MAGVAADLTGAHPSLEASVAATVKQWGGDHTGRLFGPVSDRACREIFRALDHPGQGYGLIPSVNFTQAPLHRAYQAARKAGIFTADNEDPRTFFTTHHQAYVTSPGHARGQDLKALVDGLYPEPGQRALDVATGAGHTAIQLAERHLSVTVTDITPAMLQDALALARERGLDVTAVEAPAEALPFDDHSFHCVTSRRAPHHFNDISQFLQEARRVLVPAGRIGISDMTGSTTGIDWLNRLERLRDPSHRQALSIDGWYQVFVAAGFENVTIHVNDEPMTILEWLAPVSQDTDSGQAALQFLHSPDAPDEFVRDHTFIKRRILIWAENPTNP